MRSATPILLAACLAAALALAWLLGPSERGTAEDAVGGVAPAIIGAPSIEDRAGDDELPGRSPDAADAPASGQRRIAAASDAAADSAGGFTLSEERRAQLEAGPLSALTGRVRDAVTGRAVEDVQVTLELEEVRSGGRTGSDGRFEIPWPEDIAARLSLRDPRYVDLIREDQSVPDDLEIELLPAARLTVVLTPTPEDAVEGEVRAWLRASNRERDWESFAATPAVAEDGTTVALFADLAPGEYALAGRLGELFLPFRAGLDLAPGEDRVEVVALERGQFVRGRVLQTDGVPVEGADVELRLRDSGMPRGAEREFRFETISDAAGDFELPRAAPGTYSLRVAAPWGAQVSEPVELDSSATAIQREVVLTPPSVLAGSVVDGRGRPIAGSEVRAVQRRERKALESVLDATADDGSILAARTDREGLFQIDGLPSDQSLLVVALPPDGRDDLVPTQERIGRLGDEGGGPFVRLVLEGGRDVSGVVSDRESGDPLAGAEMELVYPSGRAEVPWRTTTTDAMGRFTLVGALEGTPVVYARAEGYREGRQRVTVAPDEPEPSLDFRLEPVATLEVRVIDVDGFALAGVRVRVGPELGDRASKAERELAKSRSVTRTSDAFGSAVFEGLSHGSIAADLPGGRHELVELRPRRASVPEDAEVTLVARVLPREQTATVVGSVVTSESGAPVEGLSVGGLDGGVLRREADRFEVTGVVPGVVRVRLQAPGRVPITIADVDVLPGAEVDLGAHALRPAVRVEVVVRDADGEPVEGARVRLRALPVAAGGLGEDHPRLNLGSVGPGRYATDVAEAAEWVLRVTHRDYRAWQARVEIPDDPTWETESELIPR